jgi:16S rRNA (cytosine967-C5)-methyltransferase
MAFSPFQVVMDALARCRAESRPLHRILEELGRRRRWGKSERAAIRDVRAAWERHGGRAQDLVSDDIKARGGRRPPAREQDRVALLIALVLDGAEAQIHAESPRPLPNWGLELTASIRASIQDAPGQVPSSLPGFFMEALGRAYGEDAADVAEGLLGRAKPTFAVDTGKLGAAEAVARLQAEGIDARVVAWVDGAIETPAFLNLRKLPTDLGNAIWPMDPGSLAVSWALGATPKMRVLDLCAGGGGKARALRGRGIKSILHDASPRRLHAALKRSPDLEGFAVVGDGGQAPFAPGSFDRILIDAPCTASGTLRRHPERLARMHVGDLQSLPRLQARLINDAARMLKNGGVMIYATCSVFEEENQEVVLKALKANPDLVPHPLKELWETHVKTDLPADAAHHQLLPSRNDCDGFFMAALRRR